MGTYYPSKEDVHELAKHGNLVPIWHELPADLETPVSVYLKLRGQGSGSFLLESVEKAEHVGRYSFLGCDPSGMLVAVDGKVTILDDRAERPAVQLEGDPLTAAEEMLLHYQPVPVNGLPRFCGGLVGYLGYDTVRYFEPVPLGDGPGIALPDAIFLLADSLVIFDHVKHQLLVVANAHINGDPEAAYADATAKIDHIVACLREPIPARAMEGKVASHTHEPDWQSNFDQPSFEAMVRTAKEYIAAGEIFQVVLSQRLSRSTAADPFSIYRALRMVNPSPYMFYLELPDEVRLIGASPEMLTRLDGHIAEVRPIAGTRPRGENPGEDDELAEELLGDPKERAEHIMLVDLGRNDLGRVCRYGTVQVPEMMVIERYSHVMHIVSDVQGEIRDDLGAFDLLRATFPAGTVSGAPKVRAMEIIAELEGERRAHYAGAIGYIGYSGNSDTCIAIRTIAMRGDTVHVQAGAGIVADSDPTREYHETLSKAEALAEAVKIAETEDWTAMA